MVQFNNILELENFSFSVLEKLTEMSDSYNVNLADFPGLKKVIFSFNRFKELCKYLIDNCDFCDLYSEVVDFNMILEEDNFSSVYNLPDYNPAIYFTTFKKNLNRAIFLRLFEPEYTGQNYEIYLSELLDILSDILGCNFDYSDNIIFPIYIPNFSNNTLTQSCLYNIIDASSIFELERLIMEFINLYK